MVAGENPHLDCSVELHLEGFENLLVLKGKIDQTVKLLLFAVSPPERYWHVHGGINWIPLKTPDFFKVSFSFISCLLIHLGQEKTLSKGTMRFLQTAWSTVVFGLLCLDPRLLNKAIQWLYYPLPTHEDVSSKLAKVKYFSELAAKLDSWNKLSHEFSPLMAFNTVFGKKAFPLVASWYNFSSRMSSNKEWMKNVTSGPYSYNGDIFLFPVQSARRQWVYPAHLTVAVCSFKKASRASAWESSVVLLPLWIMYLCLKRPNGTVKPHQSCCIGSKIKAGS